MRTQKWLVTVLVFLLVFAITITSALAYSSSININTAITTKKFFKSQNSWNINVDYGVLRLYSTSTSNVPKTDLPQHFIIESYDCTLHQYVADRDCGTAVEFDSNTDLTVPTTNWQKIHFKNATQTRYIKGPVTITADQEKS